MKKQISYLLALCMTASCMAGLAVTAHADTDTVPVKTVYEFSKVSEANQYRFTGDNNYYLNWTDAGGSTTANAKNTDAFKLEADVSITVDSDKDTTNDKIYVKAIEENTAFWSEVKVRLRSCVAGKGNNGGNDQQSNFISIYSLSDKDHPYITLGGTNSNFHISIPLSAFDNEYNDYPVIWEQLKQLRIDVILNSSYNYKNTGLDDSTGSKWGKDATQSTYTDLPLTLSVSNAKITTTDYSIELQALVDEKLTETDYTNDSWEAYQSALTTAKDASTDVEIYNAYITLKNAKMNLKKEAPAGAVIFTDKTLNLGDTTTSFNTDWIKLNNAAIDMKNRREDFTLHLKITAASSDPDKVFNDLVSAAHLRVGNKANSGDTWSQENNIQNYGTSTYNSIEINVPLSSNFSNGTSSKGAVNWDAVDGINIFGSTKVAGITLTFTEIWITDSKTHYTAATATNTFVQNITVTAKEDPKNEDETGTTTNATAVMSTITAGSTTINKITWKYGDKEGATTDTTITLNAGKAVFGLILDWKTNDIPDDFKNQVKDTEITSITTTIE